MFGLIREPIKQKLLVLAGVLLLVLVTITSTEVYLRHLTSDYTAAESNQMAHRRLGRVIIRELIAIERDVCQLATLTDARDVSTANKNIVTSLDSISTILGILQRGGTFVDMLPANLNNRDTLTETFSYRKTNRTGYNIAVIDLTPKIVDIRGLCAQFVDAVTSRLAATKTPLDHPEAETQLLYKQLHTYLLRARENATKIFFESHREIERLQQLKHQAVFYVTLSHYAISVMAVAVGVFTFSRVFRQIGHIIENRRQAEDHVRTLKQQMEFILDATKTGVDIISPDHTIKYIDPGWAKIYGDPTGRKCHEYFMGRQRPCEGCGIDVALKTKSTVVTEETLVKENHRPIQVTSIPYQDDQGHWLVAEVKVDISERRKLDAKLEQYQLSLEEKVKERTQELLTINESLNREIDERIKAEQRAQESRETLQAIIDSMPVGVVIIGQDRVIRQANLEAIRLTGHQTPEDLIGRKCHNSFCPAHHDSCPILDLGKEVDRSERVLITTAGSQVPILKSVVPVMIDQEQMLLETFTDIMQLKAAEAELKRTSQRLIEASHQAGKAEVATNVLHNVGNVLNSVNVSTTLINDIVVRSEVPNLKKVAGIIEDHMEDLGTFLTQDKRGKVIPGYLIKVTQVLSQEQDAILAKIASLTKDVDHIKEIIKTQQAFARNSGVEVQTTLENVLEDALRINQDGLDRRRVQVKRQYAPLDDVWLNKQKVVEILVNLIANAKDALENNPEDDRILSLRFDVHDEEYVRIEVIDNGVGISSEHLIQIFRHGFTTKKHGHGFGLHSGALAAKEMGGSLTVVSEGIGQGACFMLDIPFVPTGAKPCTTS